MITNEEIFRRRGSAVARGVGSIHPIAADRALGSRVWDVEGNEYIDFAAGFAVLNTGHLHPRVIAAVERQLERLSHTCFHVMAYEPYVELAERLNALVPGTSPKKTLLVNSGAEAVENAIKIARSHTGRAAVIAFDGGYHGRTLLAAGLTGRVHPFKAGFGPFPAEVYHAEFPNTVSGISVERALSSVERLLRSDVEPERVAAVVVEPVLGQGGFHVAPPEFLQGLRELTRRHGIALIIDEVQTGFGRTGRMFGIEHSGVEPDIVVMAKALAGGFPLAAITGRAEIMDSPPPGGLGSTYGGHPLAIAAALAVLEVLQEEGLVERAQIIGQRLKGGLERLRSTVDTIGDIRGIGAMVAVEFFKSTSEGDRVSAVEVARHVLSHARAKGLILPASGMYGNVIRFLPPLTTTDRDLERAIGIVSDAIREAADAAERRGEPCVNVVGAQQP